MSSEFQQSKKAKKAISFVLRHLQSAMDERGQTRHHFNDRTLKSFLDDNEKRANSYTPDRASQGKADWQANFFHPTTRNKLKAVVASMVQTIPKPIITAVNSKNNVDVRAADIIREIVRDSWMRDGNPEVENFFDIWTAVIQGTLIKYEGYLKTKKSVKFVKSIGLNGKVDIGEEDTIVEDQPYEECISLMELYIGDFFIRDIQKQPFLIRRKVYQGNDFRNEYGHLEHFKHVKPKDNAKDSDTDTFFTENWKQRVGDGEYEVLRFYSVPLNRYIIIANGICLLDVPMLWGKLKKRYPFSKTIFEPFAERSFFYGNSLPNSTLGEQDVINSLYNMVVDKGYRSILKPILAGAGNHDAFDFEDDVRHYDTVIEVEDVQQVKNLDIEGLNAADTRLMELMEKGIAASSVDQLQSGVAERGITARAVVIANENARRLRTIFLLLLSDFWVQKTKLRILNLILHYSQPIVEEVVGEEKAREYKSLLIKDSELSWGKKGTLAVEIVEDESKLPSEEEVNAEEDYFRKDGTRFEKVVITRNYLDRFEFEVAVIPETLFKSERAEKQAKFLEKLKIFKTLFPEKFEANKDEVFKEFTEIYEDDANRYGKKELPVPRNEEAEKAVPALYDSLAKDNA